MILGGHAVIVDCMRVILGATLCKTTMQLVDHGAHEACGWYRPCSLHLYCNGGDLVKECETALLMLTMCASCIC